MTTLSNEELLRELLGIKSKLKKFNDQIEQGDLSWVEELSVKLRIIYLDKSGRKSLLKIISDRYSFEVRVYVRRSLRDRMKGILSEETLSSMSRTQLNSAIKWFVGGEALVSIYTAIENKDEVIIGGNTFSYKDLIEIRAEKMGGAHVDETVAEHMLLPQDQTFTIGGLSHEIRALHDLASRTVELINMVDKFVKDRKSTTFVNSLTIKSS